MDDTSFLDAVRAQLVGPPAVEAGEGRLQVWAGAVPRVPVLLIDTLTESSALLKRVLAADLTTDLALLSQRGEYLAAYARLVKAGGSVGRLFICFADDLARRDYARALLAVVDRHRSLGVTCGLAVRDYLTGQQAADFVVISCAAVVVEEEHGDAAYARGRSSVHFAGVSDWIIRFETMWSRGNDSAPVALGAYEAMARSMIDTGVWDEELALDAAQIQ